MRKKHFPLNFGRAEGGGGKGLAGGGRRRGGGGLEGGDLGETLPKHLVNAWMTMGWLSKDRLHCALAPSGRGRRILVVQAK